MHSALVKANMARLRPRIGRRRFRLVKRVGVVARPGSYRGWCERCDADNDYACERLPVCRCYRIGSGIYRRII